FFVWYGLGVILLYQRIGAIFMSIHRDSIKFCLNFQVIIPILQVGKLSLLKELKSIKSVFVSDQWGGKTKNYTIELEIDKLRINRDKHRIEVSDSKLQKVYIYILEGDFNKVRVPGTGVPYKELDYTRIDDVENRFRTAFTCVFKESLKGVECSAPEINCQFLGDGNNCVCENSCTFQRR
uniref:hypothetical protein n=1 Tax=Acetatifactor sp. TaxID=1872090 RepID=UPI004056447A